MRTEQDLHEAFRELAENAPHPGDVRATVQDGSRRSAYRRTALVIGTALATAAAATAAVVVPHVISTGAPVAGPDKQPSAWSNWVGFQTPKTMYEVTQVQTANRQIYALAGNDNPGASLCNFQLHRNGDFDPATIPAGSQTVKIGGRSGQLVTWQKGHNPFVPTPQGPPVADLTPAIAKTLVWQPAEGTWALLSCFSQEHLGTTSVPTVDAPYLADLKLIMTIARTVSPGPQLLHSPFEVGDGLAGLTPRHISYRPTESGASGNGRMFVATWQDGNTATGYRPEKMPKAQIDKNTGQPIPFAETKLGNPTTAPGLGDDLQIAYDTTSTWNLLGRLGSVQPDGTIQGMHAYFTNDQSMLRTGDTKAEAEALRQAKNVLRLEGNGVAVEIKSLGNQLTHDQLRRIAETLKLTSSPSDIGSWFDAATAIR
ncbi:hypothetical protein [Kribbella sp. NPDC048928]|uniref:hypothetical protein n=1 Tax=Kribbella sp. NPDC048928 TaxID=3364111 RepID=UPI003717DE3C